MFKSNENLKDMAKRLVRIIDELSEIVGKEIDVFDYVASACRPHWDEEDIATLVAEVRALRTVNHFAVNQAQEDLDYNRDIEGWDFVNGVSA